MNNENKSHEEILEKYHRDNIFRPPGNFIFRDDALKAMADAVEAKDRQLKIVAELVDTRDKEIAELNRKMEVSKNLSVDWFKLKSENERLISALNTIIRKLNGIGDRVTEDIYKIAKEAIK